MPDIDSLRETKEALFSDKKGLLDKRRESLVRMKALGAEISDTKNQRNQFNQQVQENKRRRSDADKRIKQVTKDIQGLRQLQSGERIPGRVPELETTLKSLEWKYQTQAMKPSEDKRMSKKIQEITLHLSALKELDRSKKDLRQKQEELSDLQKEQKIYHLSVLSNAERSEAKHQELLGLYKRRDELKDEKDSLDGQLGPISEKIANVKDKLKGEFDKVKEDREKVVARAQKTQEKLLEEKAKLVKEKIKNGEKLTTADILIIQQADLDV